MCQRVPGFEQISTESQSETVKSETENERHSGVYEYREQHSNDIFLQTVRQAIDLGFFKSFDEFEFAVFRLIEQG